MMKADGTGQKAKYEGQAARAVRRSFCLLPFACCLSCSSLPELPWAPVARDASAGFYETARLEYRLDAGKLGQPLDVIRVQGRQVGYDQVASSPLAEQSIGTLVIQYPHPAGRPEMARVTFTLDSSRHGAEPPESANPFKPSQPAPGILPGHEEVHEIWALDIPRSESDRYFQLLSTQNFYAAAPVESGPAELAVSINGKQLRKKWEQLAELNALAQRVRGDGQLVGYLRPDALAGLSAPLIASTRIYREMLAQTDSRTAAPASVAAGSSAAAARPSVAGLPPTAR